MLPVTYRRILFSFCLFVCLFLVVWLNFENSGLVYQLCFCFVMLCNVETKGVSDNDLIVVC